MTQTVLYNQFFQFASLTFLKCIDKKNIAAHRNPIIHSFRAVASVRAIVLFVLFSFSSRAAENAKCN